MEETRSRAATTGSTSILAHEVRRRLTEAPPGSDSLATAFLHGMAAVATGAAALVFVAVALARQDDPIAFLLAGAVFFGLGIVLRETERYAHLSDACLVAGLVALAGAAFARPVPLYPLIVMLAATFLLAWRHERPFARMLATLAYVVAASTWAVALSDGDASGSVFWLAAQLVLLGGLVGIDRLARRDDAVAPVGVAAFVLALPLAAVYGSVVALGSSVAVEIATALTMGAVVGAGVLLRHRGVIIGATVALVVVCVVLAFDAGGPYTGGFLLLLLAGFLAWQAELLRRRVVESAGVPKPT